MKKDYGDIMFKKTVLVGILFIALLILSGCGTYSKDCKESNTYKCYGGLHVPKLADAANNECGDTGFKTVGNLCFAVGDATRCNQLDKEGLDWYSINVPKYNTNFCVEKCSVHNDCGGSTVGLCLAASGINSYSTYNFCAPTCSVDADCLPGLTHCELVASYNKKYCLPNSDLTTGSLVARAPSSTISKDSTISKEVVQIQPSSDSVSVDSGLKDQLLGLKSDLIVELVANVPTGGFKVQPTPQKFWVDIYVTPATYTSFSDIYIRLKSSDVATFTGNLKDGNLYTFGTPQYKDQGYERIISNIATQNLLAPARYKLGSLEMSLLKDGNLAITLDTEKSSASAGLNLPYTLPSSTAKIATTSWCVPKTSPGACSGLNLGCGKSTIDDGCGGKVECTSSTPLCPEGSLCVDNKCEKAASKALPTAAKAHDKKAVEDVSSALSNPSLANKFQKLSALLQALKAWYADPSNQ